MIRELRAIAFLGILAKENRLVTVTEIANTLQQKRNTIDLLISYLRDGGLIHTIAGTRGGHRLAKQPEEISVTDVIRCFHKEKRNETDNAVLDYFGSHTIEDIVSYNESCFFVKR